MDELVRRTIIVTGAAGGIGRQAAITLAAAGANVVATDVIELDRDTVETIQSSGGNMIFVRADIGLENEVEALVARALETYGRLDGAFNNAGVEQCAIPLHKLTAEQWNRALQIDLTGIFFCMKHQIKAMLESGGSIVNTASSLGQVAIPNASEYVAAKHGVIGLTKAAAADYGPNNIRVNAVLPGIIETPMIGRLVDDPAFTAYFDKLRERHALGRFGAPIEVAETVKWLLSDAASFVTGAAISVDGGYLAI